MTAYSVSDHVCPMPYKQWAVVAHPPLSTGPLHLPSMRPPLSCRTFTSPAVEQALERISLQIKDADIRQLFANTLPNTLDTAIAWHHSGDYPYTFVITGDINAQWTRDSANQLLPLLPYTADDLGLSALVAGLVNMQAEQIAEYPYANAYKPPKRSGLVPGESDWARRDVVSPPPDLSLVFEAKFEIDSLASFFKLSTAYWRQHGSHSLDVEAWKQAVAMALDLLVRLQAPTFDADQRITDPVIRFVRTANSATETSAGGGRGNPGRRTGMCRTLFRPSDDSAVFPYHVPANAMLAVELRLLAPMLDALGGNATVARQLADDITRGIYDYGVAEHPEFGRVFAYEVDGYGGRLLMDDANVPSLLALPYLGFVSVSDPLYQNTRRMVLSPSNPWYFANGGAIEGIGSPHTGFRRAWPMAVAVQALTSQDQAEIIGCVRMLATSTGGLGLMHESVDVDTAEFTRPWFAWCNGVVSELIAHAVKEYPGLL
ncbi:hypothetical protein GGI20_003631 [Coemansia sp. BCRC 34301]|nr:hypothetical protein GGI20_003631 [Coemansia sp. BCRC 34301]